MHPVTSLNRIDMKMSVCSEFVEHIWKPGSCKNCFHPRSEHRKPQYLSDGKNSLSTSHNFNGIKVKSDLHQDEDTVVAALYSKPTIAVKPTMLTSESEVWTEINSTETLTQASWKVSQGNSALKSGEVSRTLLDNFSKPLGQSLNSLGDGIPEYVYTGLKSPERMYELNSVHNLTYISHFGGQADKATFIKEKPVSFEPSSHGNLVNGDTKQLNCIQEESTMLSLKSSSGYSSGTLSSTEKSTPPGTLITKNNPGTSSKGLPNIDMPVPVKPARKLSDKSCLKGLKLVSSNEMHFSKLKISHKSESETLSDNLSCNITRGSPLTSPVYTDSQTTEFQLSKECRKNLTTQCHKFTHTEKQLHLQAKGNQTEPIYAESTKRKGALGRLGSNQRALRGAGKNSEENQETLNCCRLFQESTTQVAAKITVMAAHTEEDNKTIFLSSPDSAVGVQWACNSPSYSSEHAHLSPTFVWGEKTQRQETETVEICKSYQGPLSPKNYGNLSKMIKLDEGTSMKGSSSMHTAGVLNLASHRKESLELNDRCLASVDRRNRFYQAQWSKQCKIEEEEEEEPLDSQQYRKGELGSGQLASSFNLDGRPMLEEQRISKGMCKSASCPVELSKVKNEKEDSTHPPPPPPKKQARHPLKQNKSISDLEVASLGSVESLGESFKATNISSSNVNISVSFSTGSIDSLDSRTCSEGGHSCEVANSPGVSPRGEKKHFTQTSLSMDTGDEFLHSVIQPPPLPMKKSMNRASSVPDNSALGRNKPPKTLNGPRFNHSQSENNVCGEEAMTPGFPLSPGEKHAMFSSSESLEKCCRGNEHKNEMRRSNCLQGKGPHSSQLSVSSHNSSGSSLQLHHLLSNIDSKESMYGKLSSLYAQATRRLVNKCEEHFMREQKQELHFNENNWSQFKLTSNKPCCISGDAIYYCATCTKEPENKYAIKLCKVEDAKAPSSISLPVHFNIQQDCGNFLATVPSSMLHPSTTCKSQSADDNSQMVGPGNDQECVVVINREVPYLTTDDFVMESVSSHQLHPEIYERQVCLLLLQLCNGLEHLKEHGIIHRDLCLENLLLVHWHNSPKKIKDLKYVPRLIVSNFSKAKQRSGCEESKPRRDKTRLAPEIMAASQYKKFDEFQTGILIYELLHQPNPFEVRTSLHEHDYSQKDLPPLPALSVYSQGLQHLAHLLLEADPIKRIRITEAKRILQCLLWGPRKDLTDQPFNHEEAFHCALQNWIDMKRSLLMMKFAEKALEPQQSISLEDWLCCQYLACADPCYLYKTLKLIKLIGSVSTSTKI